MKFALVASLVTSAAAFAPQKVRVGEVGVSSRRSCVDGKGLSRQRLLPRLLFASKFCPLFALTPCRCLCPTVGPTWIEHYCVECGNVQVSSVLGSTQEYQRLGG